MLSQEKPLFAKLNHSHIFDLCSYRRRIKRVTVWKHAQQGDRLSFPNVWGITLKACRFSGITQEIVSCLGLFGVFLLPVLTGSCDIWLRGSCQFKWSLNIISLISASAHRWLRRWIIFGLFLHSWGRCLFPCSPRTVACSSAPAAVPQREHWVWARPFRLPLCARGEEVQNFSVHERRAPVQNGIVLCCCEFWMAEGQRRSWFNHSGFTALRAQPTPSPFVSGISWWPEAGRKCQ